jgi:predicted PurR-regulated permease PerM
MTQSTPTSAFDTPDAPSPRWNTLTKWIVSLGALVLLVLLALRVRDIFPLLVVSLLIAYLLNPLVDFNERRLLRWLPFGRRSFGIVLALLIAIAVLLLALLIILPVVGLQVRGFLDNLPEQFGTFEARLTEVLSQPISFNNAPILIDGQPLVPLEQLQRATGNETLSEMLSLEDLDIAGAVGSFTSSLGGLTRPVFSFVGGAFTTFINLTFFLVMLFYLLKDGRKFISTIIGYVPPSYQGDAGHLIRETGGIWNAYFRGQLILSTWVGVIVFVTTTMLGLPNALVLGLISALLEFVPNIGPFIAMIPAAFVALISTSTTIPGLSGFGFALVVVILYFVIQNVQAILVTPRVMGDNLDLHPFLVILAVIIGASLAGALGVILAAPFMANFKLIVLYLYAKLTDRQPFADPQPPARIPEATPPALPPTNAGGLPAPGESASLPSP